MIHYTIQGLFAYINVFLLACSDEITRQQAEFLDVYQQELGSGEIIAHQAQVSILFKPGVAIASKKISSEVYLEKVKLWLEYNEELKNTFDQVQKTFSWKLLFDTATLCLGLFMQLAYISTWLLKPTTDLSTVGIVVNLIRHIVYLVTYLLCGWIVLYRPLSLYKMHHNRSDVMGKILAERRRSSCEEPSNEEILLSMMVMKKTDDGGLVYKAGTILPLGPKVVCTISAAVFAFGWFVIQRSLDFKAKL
ncbi:hypothetical protein BV898_05972 [Hypsibius exemplaris]|uniref:Uncharacterized protein n=1 Tax=Hypsibius exemplaris TaxID=2072580 RepID=A0A1W0WXN3_HYPEX|nr:hypothetical protein BV898_05972 [Hypsibius exemplaris]